MIKILHLQLLPLLYGAQNMMLHLMQSLPRDQFEIYVASQPGRLLEYKVKELGFNYTPINALRHSISPMDWVALSQILRIIRRHRFDIVHTHSSKTGLLGGIAAYLLKVPLAVHTLHGNPFHWGQSRLVYQSFVTIERMIAPLYQRLVFVNNCDRELWLKMGLTHPDKAITINNALSDELRQRLVDIASRRNDNPPKIFTIGSTMRFSPQKNSIQTVTAACHICQKHSNVRFIFAGDGEHLDLCRQIVHSLKVTDRVILPGLVSDIPPLLATFDAFLLYSNWEAQPISIIEAMHSGLPIIGSDIPSIAELVSDDCGWLIRQDNPPLLESKLLALIDLPYSQIREKGNNALSRIRHQCSYQAMADGYLNIYRTLRSP